MSSKPGVPNDRKVLLKKPSTAASAKTTRSSRTRLTATSETASQKENVRIVTKRELVTLVSELEKLKRENDSLLLKQEAKFGVTVDNAGSLKHELTKAKAINHSLLEEIKLGKEKCDRLHEDFLELQAKFESCERQLKQFRKEKKTWEDTKERLRIADDRCRRLVIRNKNMKTLLLKNRINPGTASIDEGKGTVKEKKLNISKHVRKVHDNRQKSSKTMQWI